MLAIIFQSIKRKKYSLLIFSLASLLFLWMFVGMYPSIAQESEKFQEAFSSYPEEFFDVFGVEELSFDKLEKFLAIENYSIMWPILVLFMTIAFAGTSLAGEVEKGTLSLVLARPVSRMKIFFARYIAGIIVLAIFTLLSVYFVVPLANIYNVDYSLENHFTMSILGFLFGWAIFSLSFMFSAVFSEKSKTYMVMGGITVGMYMMNVVANLRENWEDLKYFSFFHYFDYNGALLDNIINWETYLVFITTIIVATVCGVLIFQKRDIAI